MNDILLSYTNILDKYYNYTKSLLICSQRNKKSNIIGDYIDFIMDFYSRYKMIFKKYNINTKDDIEFYFNKYIKTELLNYNFHDKIDMKILFFIL